MPTIRPLRATDIPAARALLVAEDARHAYAARAVEILDAVVVVVVAVAAAAVVVVATASGDGDGEYGAVAAVAGEALLGVALHGVVAGSEGAGMIHGIVVAPAARRAGVGRGLVDGAVAALVSSGARVVLAELPDDPALGDLHALLRRSGFVEDGRVADLVRDGVAMVFWRRDAPGPG